MWTLQATLTSNKEIITGYFGCNIQKDSWTNGLQVTRTILEVYKTDFSARLSRV